MKKLVWIDILNWALTLFVVLGHSIPNYMTEMDYGQESLFIRSIWLHLSQLVDF
jgi:hypothetical protein